jgi:hypothetical protein
MRCKSEKLRWKRAAAISSASLGFALGACGSSPGSTGTPGALGLSLSSSVALAPQDGTPAKITATVTGNSGPVTLAVGGVPSGTLSQVVEPGSSGSGAITLTSSAGTPAGSYSLKVTATDGGSAASQALSMVVAVSAMVGSTVDQRQGVTGKLEQFMSTSFQPAEWDYQYFQNHAALEPAQLNQLGPQHIRLQGLSQAVPMKSNTGAATDWDFSKLDAVVQPVLSAADHSPEFQIAVAPRFMYNAQGTFDIANHLQDFANYSADLVRYYNGPGFDWGGQHFASPSLLSANPHKITWWGIFNEYNINGLTPAEYVELYNTVVPAMLAVDSTIQFSALELSDFDFQEGDPRNNLPTFVLPAAQGGVNAQVNIVSTHFYSSCNQNDTDAQIFSTIPGFANDVKYFYQELKLRPDLGSVPVWVTENNVNADFADASGNSTCNPTQKFVLDLRGTSAFFAAWRPYVFAELGKAGNQALFHWDYDSDAQFGEVDYSSGSKHLSYWVDDWLAKLYPGPPAAPDILALTVTETATVETLATKNGDGSVLVMIADRAVLLPTDNNGTGDARTVVLDVSALGTFTSASQLNIGATSDLTSGPQPGPITLAPKLTVTLPGYGVSFLLLKP